MANGVYYVGLGIELNCTRADLGHPELPGLWELLRADKRPPEKRGLQCIECMRLRPGCPEWMVLVERDGRRFARHHTPGIGDHPEAESDEHKAYKERVIKAAELGGFRAEPESRSVDGKRRTDVLVAGGVQNIGWEIQLSYAGLDTVRKRAALARRDSITPLWATVEATRDFIDRVPWARLEDMPWRRVMDVNRGLLVHGGIQKLGRFVCDWSVPTPCPVKGRGRCFKTHSRWEVRRRVQLDDLVRASASGEFVPVVYPRDDRKGYNRWWVTAADRDRFLDAGGKLLPEGDYRRSHEKGASTKGTPARPVDPHCHYGEDSGYRSKPAEVRDDGADVVTATSPTPELPFDQAVLLDWSSRTHWGGGAARPCRNCGKPAFLVDDYGAPMHKTCAERTQTGGAS